MANDQCFSVPPWLRGHFCLAIVSVCALSVTGCSNSATSSTETETRNAKTDNTTVLESPYKQPVEVVPEEAQTVASGKGSTYHDPETGQIARLALSCNLPDCPGKGDDGKPYVFCRVSSGKEFDRTSPGEEPSTGNITTTQGKWPVATERHGAPFCPACDRNVGVHHYEPPQALERRELLEEELRAARAARRAAKQAGEPMPTDHRTPAAIMQDLSNLPKLYLLLE